MTGESHTLEEFIDTAFAWFDIDWHDYVVFDQSLMRPTELITVTVNPAKAKKCLQWEAQYMMKDVVRMMIMNQNDSSMCLI